MKENSAYAGLDSSAPSLQATNAGVEQHWQILTGRRKRNTPSKSPGANGQLVASVIVEATADVSGPPKPLLPYTAHSS